MFVPTHQASVWLVLVLTASAAVVDLRTGLIPNRLLVWALGLLIVAKLAGDALVDGRPLLSVMWTSLAGALACALIPLLLWLGNGMGGGDLKLLALVGAALGPFGGMEVELYAFMLGSLFALLVLAYRGVLLRALFRSLARLFSRTARAASANDDTSAISFRFGPAIFAGALTFVAQKLVLS